MSNNRTRRVQSMYGASSHSQAATPGVENKDVIFTGDPVSALAQVSGRRALVLAQVPKLSAAGQSAPFSLPSSQAFSKSTIIEATVLQLLLVVGETGVQAKADEQLWQWGGRHVGSISMNGSLVATVDPSLMLRAVGSAASQAVTCQLSSTDLDQLFDDACLLLSTVPDSLPAVRGLPADAHLPYKLGEHSMFCDASAGQGDDTLPCLVCAVRNPAAPKAYIKREGMRKHIAAHILKDHIRVDACGFCGIAGSSTPRLTGKGASLQPDRQSCAKVYGCKFSYGPCLKVNTRSCTNIPMPCPSPGCCELRWMYTMVAHWQEAHSD
jgi:hypothetical protein